MFLRKLQPEFGPGQCRIYSQRVDEEGLMKKKSLDFAIRGKYNLYDDEDQPTWCIYLQLSANDSTDHILSYRAGKVYCGRLTAGIYLRESHF